MATNNKRALKKPDVDWILLAMTLFEATAFLMLAFSGLCKFDLLKASGNTKAANSASNLASLITFAMAGKVMWSVGIPAAVCGIAGNYVGSGLALKKGAKIIRPMFFVVLVLLLLRLVSDMMG